MNEPIPTPTPTPPHSTISPTVMTIVAVLVASPGVGGLIQSSNTNTALNKIETTLLGDLEARSYLETQAKLTARYEERLDNLSAHVDRLERDLEEAETKLSIKSREGLSGANNRMDRLGERITRIGMLVATKLHTLPPAMMMTPAPFQPLPQSLPYRNTERLIRASTGLE